MNACCVKSRLSGAITFTLGNAMLQDSDSLALINGTAFKKNLMKNTVTKKQIKHIFKLSIKNGIT
jgi:hypothetical protein